jgi:hypothetical protein
MPTPQQQLDQLERDRRRALAGLEQDRFALLQAEAKIERLTIAQQLLTNCGFEEILAANNSDSTWVCPHRDATNLELERLGDTLDSAMDTIRHELRHAGMTADQLQSTIARTEGTVASMSRSIGSLNAEIASTSPPAASTTTSTSTTSSLNGPR